LKIASWTNGKNGLRKGRPLDQIQHGQRRLLTIAVDDDRLAVMVDIAVAIALLDHDGFVTIVMVTLPDNFTIAIAIAMNGSDGHASRADTYANFVRSGRHGDANSGHGDSYYCKTLDHCLLLSV
jgi:hypothetical protein